MPCSRAGTGGGATRTSASSRGSRAPTRRLRGADLEGFVRFVRDQESFGARELEAVAEEEGADVVRLLTIHAAKGLEFKVVIVADAGRDTGGPPTADEILALSDGRFGFKMVHPTRGDRRPVFGYEEVRDASAAQERAERLRLYYVAMTRAIDRLIVSGAVDPERESDRETPIGWVIERLEAAPRSPVPGASRWSSSAAGRAGSSGSTASSREQPAAAPEPEPARARGGAAVALRRAAGRRRARPAPTLPALEPMPLPPAHVPRRLSYSAIALFDTCSYRYYAERVLGSASARARTSAPATEGAGWPRPRSATPRTACSSSSRSTHPCRRPRTSWPRRYAGGTRRVSDEELARIAGFVEAYCALAARAPDRSARRTSGRSGRSPSSTTACSCTAGSTRSR